MKDFKIQEMMNMLQCAIDSITNSQEYQAHLKAMAKFPAYSYRNTLLIIQQCPQATLVAGFSTWKKDFKRYVKKGEKAIRIFAPYTYTQKALNNDGTETEVVRKSFRSVSVFDISQTDGPPLPQPAEPVLLEGNLEQYENLLEGFQACTDYEICFVPLHEQNGICRHGAKQILVQENLGQLQSVKTLCHEVAHSLLHDPYLIHKRGAEKIIHSSELKEIEAESTAYIVCTYLGMDCSAFSFPYIAGWKKTDDFLEESLERISQVSAQIIETLECFLEKDRNSIRPASEDHILKLAA